VLAVVLSVAFMMAVPASALEITTDGYYRARYIGAWNVKMTKNLSDNAANSYGDMRLRVNNVLKVNDNLMLRTRFRALNGKFWGGAYDGKTNFDWERAWLVARFSFGSMEVGRMSGGAWGLAFGDSESDFDRVKLTVPVGPVAILLIYQKSAELDNNFATNDSDADTFYPAINWKGENMSAGLLGAYTWGKTSSDIGAGAFKSETGLIIPYFSGKFGPFGLIAEGRWNFGKANKYYDKALKDRNSKAWQFLVEGSFDFGMGTAELGYAWTKGENSKSKDQEGITFGDDWEKMYILTGSTGPVPGSLGGYGNWSATGGNLNGLQMIYGGATFKPMENLSVGGLFGWGKVDKTESGQNNDAGWEIDLFASYTIFDNLTNTFKVAYLDAGDYFMGSKNDPGYADRKKDFESSVWAFHNELKLSF
jgi:hypothetical protein